MSFADTTLVDVNAALGPWPDGNAPELERRTLLAWLDRLGIGRALVHHSTARWYDPALGNERLLRELGGDERLLPCFVLGPLETGEFGPPGDMPAALADHGVRAVRVYPREHGWRLAGRESELLFATVVAAGLPVFVDLAQTDWADVDSLLERHPALQLVVCTVGYRELRRLVPLLGRHPGLSCDLSYFGSHRGLEAVVARFGPGRLLFGSGMPVAEPAGPVACLAWADIEDDARRAIGAGNAERLLGLEPAGRAAPGAARDGALGAMRAGAPLAGFDVLDVHGHLGAWPAFWLPEQEESSLVAQLDRCGVATIAISSLLAIGPDAPTGNAEALAAAAASAGRIVAYVVADPHRPELAETLERQLTLPEVVGIKVHPDTHTCSADAAAYGWVWELAERTGSPVLAHTFAGTPWADPFRFDRVAERHGEVRIVLAHAGVSPDGFRRTIEVCARHPQLVVDTSGSHMTGFWIRRLVDALGPERVLYGSDAPFIDMRYGLGRVVGAGLADDVLRRVLGDNARELLGVPSRRSHSIPQGG